MAPVKAALATVADCVNDVREIARTLDPATGNAEERRARFDALTAQLSQNADAARQHMARTMESFAPGLFAGGDDPDLPTDNLDLERAFRLPKGHERRIHGHAHAGSRIVQRGATLCLALDAHARHPQPWSAEQLAPWVHARPPESQRCCLRRRHIMRRARSQKQRQRLLDELERRYAEAAPGS